MKYLPLFIWTIWLLSEILLNRLFLSGKKGRQSQDRHSMGVIWLVLTRRERALQAYPPSFLFGIADPVLRICPCVKQLPRISGEIDPGAGRFLYRIRIEERALVERFGQEYRDYMKRTKKLIPFFY